MRKTWSIQRQHLSLTNSAGAMWKKLCQGMHSALREAEGGDLARAAGAVDTEAAPYQPEDTAGQTIHIAFSNI